MNLEHTLYTSDFKEIKYQINKVRNILTTKATSTRSSNCNTSVVKLKLYHEIKPKFEFPDYLDLPMDSRWKNAITKFRICARNLPIESGRYLNIHREQRICPLCCLNIGSETHYLLNCDHLLIIKSRTPLFETLKESNPNFDSLLLNQKAAYL